MPNHTPEEIDDFAMRMAWANLGEEHRRNLRQMAEGALTVHKALLERARLESMFGSTPDIREIK